MSAKGNSTTDARQELAELMKRKAEIAVSTQQAGINGALLVNLHFPLRVGVVMSRPPFCVTAREI